ncbi:hypothetical protein [Mycobacterium sp.]|uniref:hypothetical protein n=1 Tax=Mycobacterium sp. TaxID=1785 RepID=UPI0031D82DAE
MLAAALLCSPTGYHERHDSRHRDRLLLVQYEALTSGPAQTLHATYRVIGEPAFEYDFGRVGYDVTEFDERAGTPDLFNRFVNDAFWRDLQRIPAGRRP